MKLVDPPNPGEPAPADPVGDPATFSSLTTHAKPTIRADFRVWRRQQNHRLRDPLGRQPRRKWAVVRGHDGDAGGEISDELCIHRRMRVRQSQPKWPDEIARGHVSVHDLRTLLFGTFGAAHRLSSLPADVEFPDSTAGDRPPARGIYAYAGAPKLCGCTGCTLGHIMTMGRREVR